MKVIMTQQPDPLIVALAEMRDRLDDPVDKVIVDAVLYRLAGMLFDRLAAKYTSKVAA